MSLCSFTSTQQAPETYIDKIVRYARSRSFKVIETSTYRKPIRLSISQSAIVTMCLSSIVSGLVENIRLFAVFTHASLILDVGMEINLSSWAIHLLILC